MFGVELYGRVRRSVLVEGRSQREVAREFGISRKTIQKMLRYAVPPGYQRLQPVKRPKLGPWVGVIDAILEDDRHRPVKQRHTEADLRLLGPLVAADAAEKEDGEDKDRGNDRAGGPFDDIDDNCVKEQ